MSTPTSGSTPSQDTGHNSGDQHEGSSDGANIHSHQESDQIYEDGDSSAQRRLPRIGGFPVEDWMADPNFTVEEYRMRMRSRIQLLRRDIERVRHRLAQQQIHQTAHQARRREERMDDRQEARIRVPRIDVDLSFEGQIEMADIVAEHAGDIELRYSAQNYENRALVRVVYSST